MSSGLRSAGELQESPPDDPPEAPESTTHLDADRIATALAKPQTGPRILFLSGGSALRELSRVLPRYTHNSTHLITPFDSGGSSASLRQAFGMLSVGDLRNRLLALADDGSPEASAAVQCFGHRFNASSEPRGGVNELHALIAGSDPRISSLTDAQQSFGRETLACFAERMPADFDLRGASVGNLVLTGGYLPDRDIRGALTRFGEVLRVRGNVLPTCEDNLHLAARLADGATVVGQHRLTGKQHPPLTSPIAEIRLVANLDGGPSLRPPGSTAATDRIREAELICLPMGSFYSSIVCNLLPSGIGRAFAETSCPKIYVPSIGHDPEVAGIDPAQATARLLAVLRNDCGEATPAEHLINRVLLDPRPDVYATAPDLSLLDRLGVEHSEIPLVNPSRPSRVDARCLAEALVSLAREHNRPRKEET